MDPAFSRPGEPPTAFEEQLLAGVQMEHPTSTKDLWLLIAQQIGLAALVRVLDQFGDEHVWVPSRSGLLKPLWSQLRDAEIERLVRQGGMSHRGIADQLKVPRTTVQRVARARHGGGPPQREKQRR